MIRVLHVVSNISKTNGVMSVLMNYYKKINKEKVQFDFLYYDDYLDTFEDEIKLLGGKTIKLPKPSSFHKFKKKLNEFLKCNYKTYQILHIHDVFMSAFLINAKKYGGIERVIIHAHATKFSDHKIGEIRNRILALANFYVPDYYFACSKKAGKHCFGRIFEKKGIVVNNAIDLQQFYEDKNDRQFIRKKLNVNDKFVIGHVGNFSYPKNHFFIIDIFKKITEQRNDVVLILVGDGNLQKKVIEYCVKLDVEDKVMFLGICNDVNIIMRAFDCLIFPSLYEGFGIVLVEAQATNIPCVFSDVVPKETNILTENNYILSLKKTSDEWANIILNLNSYSINNVSERIKDAGYSIDVEAKKLEEVYYEIRSTDKKSYFTKSRK